MRVQIKGHDDAGLSRHYVSFCYLLNIEAASDPS